MFKINPKGFAAALANMGERFRFLHHDGYLTHFISEAKVRLDKLRRLYLFDPAGMVGIIIADRTKNYGRRLYGALSE